MNTKVINDYVKEKLNKEVKVIKRLVGGMSNHTYLIEIDNELYTFRIPGKGSEHFTDRVKESEILEIVESLKFIPKAIINDTEKGYKLTPYIEGQILSEVFPKPMEAISSLLKDLHHSKKFEYDYNPLDRLESYEKITSKCDPVYLALKEKWIEIYSDKLIGIELVPCHGDAQTGNFILTDNRIYLLDWEFSANNDPIYDIACFGNVNFEEAIQLLEAYYIDANKNHYERLYAWRMYQCLQWHNVAKYKHEIGLSEDLAVNFELISDAYLDKAKGFFEDYLNIVSGG